MKLLYAIIFNYTKKYPNASSLNEIIDKKFQKLSISAYAMVWYFVNILPYFSSVSFFLFLSYHLSRKFFRPRLGARGKKMKSLFDTPWRKISNSEPELKNNMT